MLFTYNPKFDLTRKSTQKRDLEMSYLKDKLNEYGIESNRIVYLGGKGKTAKYCPESPEVLNHFFGRYPDLGKRHILSDNGGSFSEGLEKFGFKHERYPAPIHQFLSPNDNRLHGVAKKKWKTEISLDFKDDVNSSLYLMDQLDRVPQEKIKGWFKQNHCLGEKEIDIDRARKLLGKHKNGNNEFYKQCLESYRIFMHEDARGGVPDAPKGLESRLDGNSWR